MACAADTFRDCDKFGGLAATNFVGYQVLDLDKPVALYPMARQLECWQGRSRTVARTVRERPVGRQHRPLSSLWALNSDRHITAILSPILGLGGYIEDLRVAHHLPWLERAGRWSVASQCFQCFQPSYLLGRGRCWGDTNPSHVPSCPTDASIVIVILMSTVSSRPRTEVGFRSSQRTLSIVLV